jgi:hypothetical protein
VPLYNLQAHNVMTNLVVDAGTDAKIAKFLKRGLELIDLAILEPIEVRTSGGYDNGGGGSAFSGRPLLQPIPSNVSRPNTPDPSHTPTSSALSVSSAGLPPVSPPATAVPEPQPAAAPTGAKKIFGKFFKKKDTSSPSPESAPTPTRGHSRTQSIPAVIVAAPVMLEAPEKKSKRVSASFTSTLASPTGSAFADSSAVLGPPVLGIQPTLSLSRNGDREKDRPSMYVWIVRKWTKHPGGEGLLGGLVGKLKESGGSGFSMGGKSPLAHGVEVVFEWKRSSRKGGNKKREKDRKTERSTSAVRDRDEETGLPMSGPLMDGSSLGHGQAMSKRNKRLSTTSIGKQSVSTVLTSEDGHRDGAEVDAGEESDPEDSETPWSCVLKIRRQSDRPDEGSGSLKVKVAILSPTPHHPKVVGALKIPFPLPDIDIERVAVRPRQTILGGGAAGSVSGGDAAGLVLTAEEIKDVVSCTGLWLVVREGFGGVGKVNRKGDGWRIRG